MEPSAVAARSLAGLTALGAGTTIYALWEARQYTLRRFPVVLPKRDRRPARLPSLRVLHLSDLHLSPRDTDRIRWIQSLGQLQPDLVVVTGDFHGDRHAGPLALQALQPLLERPGLYVHGSNDYFAPTVGNPFKYLVRPSEPRARRTPIDISVLGRGLSDAGWIKLDNESTMIEVNEWRIATRGVDDPHIRRDRYELVHGPYPDDADLRLAVTHAPYRRVLDAMAADGADLIVAGHTHGGQICLPAFGALVTNCDLPRKQAKGVSTWYGSALHISAGLGTNKFTPIRLACRPEATLLTIQPPDA